MGTMITTPTGIEAYRLLSIYHALKLEVACPGLKHSRGSVMNLARKEFGIDARKKAKVLEEVELTLKARGILT